MLSYSNCLSCFANSEAGPATCMCKLNYYSAISGDTLTCLSCDVSCSTCEGASFSECITCVDANAAQSSGTCFCMVGFFDSDPSSLVVNCQQCHSNCLTCSDSSSSGCLSCLDVYASLISGSCQCRAGYYDADSSDGVSCQNCHESCATCEGPLVSSCISCIDPKVAPVLGTCNCIENFYDADLSANLNCLPCHSNCRSCFGSGREDCLTCTDSLAIVQSGKCTCPDQYYTVSSDFVNCRSCHLSCRTCEGPVSSNCLSCTDTLNAFLVIGSGCKCNNGFFNENGICQVCSDGFYIGENSCEPCHATCMACNGGKKNCLSCVKNAEMKGGSDCACITPYFETASGCVRRLVSFSISVDQDNGILISFTGPATLTVNDVEVVIPDLSEFTFTLQRVSQTGWLMVISTSHKIIEGMQVIITLTNSSVAGDAELANTTDSDSLHSESSPTTSDEQQANAVSSLSSTIISVLLALTAISGFTTGSNSAVWGMINNIQIIRYIPMMDLHLPLVLTQFFLSSDDISFIPNAFKLFVPDQSPRNFASARRDGINSSMFLMNAGEELTVYSVLILLWPICHFLSKVNQMKISAYFENSASRFKWNFFIRFAIEAYLPISFASLFQIHFIQFSSTSNAINGLLAIIFGSISILVPLLSLRFIKRNYTVLMEIEARNKLKDFGSLYDEFKNDQGFKSCLFQILFFIRRLFYIGILYLLEDFPIVQLGLNVAHSFGTAVYLLVFRPFEENLLNFSNIFAELCTSLTFTLCGGYLLDFNTSIGIGIQWTVIAALYAMMFVNTIVALILALRGLKLRIKRWRQRLAYTL